MAYTQTTNLKLRYYNYNATGAFDLSNALNFNWEKLDGYNPDNRLTALENAPVASNARIYSTTYTGTGATTFTISYADANITRPVMVIIYSLNATVRQNSLILFPEQATLYKAFDFNYNDSTEQYQPICEYGDNQLTIKPQQRTVSPTAIRECNELGKIYGITILGEA